MPTLSILIPSRLERDVAGKLFLESAVQSIRAQTGHSMTLQILVGIDAGASVPPGMDRLGVRFVESGGKSQAAALNEAGGAVTGDYVAILEDDDQWNQGFLFARFRC